MTGSRPEDAYWRIRLSQYPTTTRPANTDFVVAIALDGHVSTSWISGPGSAGLCQDWRLGRDATDGGVYGKATDTPAGQRGDIAELRRLWMSLFDARFGAAR